MTGKAVPTERLAQVAYVIGKYGQTRDNARAAAVDAVVYEYLAGGTYALDGARGKQRLAYPVVSPTARTLAQGYLAEAQRLAGPYSLTITPQVKTTTAGTQVTVAVKVATKAGTPVPKVSVALAESGSGTASGKVVTDNAGTASWSFTAKTAGTASISATADGLPATGLQVLTPKNPAAQRVLLAGGTTSVKDAASVTVDEAPGGITIRKKDPEGTRLAGAAFQLLDKDGKQAAEGKTDEQGVLVLDGLRAGTYRLRETSSGSPLHDLVPEQTITITAGRTAQANPLDLIDPFKKADLLVKKVDKNTGEALAGAVITIRTDETDKTGKHTHIAVVPPGLLARAICAVREGTCSPERGRRDNGHLDNCIGRRNHPSMPVDHAAAPRNSKIPDRVKLSENLHEAEAHGLVGLGQHHGLDAEPGGERSFRQRRGSPAKRWGVVIRLPWPNRSSALRYAAGIAGWEPRAR
ncbi:MSCRAMM family protein [Streptomyces sp. C10-9-1]|uniref:MSCRAMM family protein n=1 Tax=Streptomyces sp. C10-9-1 TaxID=1859285 RepID=UPI003F4A7D76